MTDMTFSAPQATAIKAKTAVGKRNTDMTVSAPQVTAIKAKTTAAGERNDSQ